MAEARADRKNSGKRNDWGIASCYHKHVKVSGTFTEFLGGHYGKLRPYIYGISVFDTKDTDVVRILSEHNNGEIDDSENDSFGFLETSIGIWKDSEEEEYWTTIGIGVEGYYTEA